MDHLANIGALGGKLASKGRNFGQIGVIFCHTSLFFNNIVGSTFIFNIFMGGVIPGVGCFMVEDSQVGGRIAPGLHRTSSLYL